MSDLPTMIGDAANTAYRSQKHVDSLKVMLGRHLRYDHKLSRRRVALALGEREKWVKDEVEAGEGET